MHWPCLSGLGEAASRCSTSGMSSYYNGPKSNHFDGERFFDREVEYAMDTATRQRPLLNTTSAVSGAPGLSLGCRPNFSVLVVYRVVPAKLATRKSDGFALSGKCSHRLAARAHNAPCSRH